MSGNSELPKRTDKVLYIYFLVDPVGVPVNQLTEAEGRVYFGTLERFKKAKAAYGW